MQRTDIENITRKGLTVIISKATEIYFYEDERNVFVVFDPPVVTSPMLDDMEASGIVRVECAGLESGFVTLSRKDFYDRMKFAHVIYSLFEKYGL
jgi:hypothetical protein